MDALPAEPCVIDDTEHADLTKEKDVAGIPVSISQEPLYKQVEQTRRWVLSGTMSYELTIVGCIAYELEVLMLSDFDTGTLSWEQKQQTALLETGSRKYAILEARYCTAEWSFLYRICELNFLPSSWLALPEPLAEYDQSMCYEITQ